jgi:signal transduction histidine kinase/HAMP domain-containing protein
MRLSERSVNTQLKWLGAALLALFPLVAGTGLWNIAAQSRDIQALTLSYGPAFNANDAALIDMTEANAGWSQAVGGLAPAGRYRLKRDLVAADLTRVQQAFDSPGMPREHRASYLAQLATQRAAVEAWFASATRAEDAVGEASPAQQSALEADATDKFRLFRDTNRGLSEAIRRERDAARTGSRSSTDVVVGVVTLTVLIAMAIVLVTWRTLQRSLSLPLERLRTVLDRQRDGDHDALADTRSGAAEVRALAAEFNGLTRANTVLRDQQAEVLLAHQLALDVARTVHSVGHVDQALYLVCAMLGEGLGVDRVMLYTHDDDGAVDQRTQWHRYDLPELPALPRSLVHEVKNVGDDLRREAGVFAVPDFLDPVVQAQDNAKGFYRATGARSLLMVPVGMGDQGLGVLSLMMVDGPRRWRRHEIQAVQQCAGYLAQAIGALRLARLQEEQVQRLTELDRQKTDFMATVSHELRTPLTSINGYLELLEDGDYGALSPPQLKALKIIDRNASRLRGLIEDLLVLNKIEASGLHTSLEDVALADLVQGVAEMLRPVATENGIALTTEVLEPRLTLHVDRTQIERVLINLGSNAVKFTPRGGRADITASRAGDRAVITVTDSGIGIPHADLTRLSERFFRAGNATAAAIPGTGLGLAIVRAILDGHGGELQVESVEGRGTTMRVMLPLQAAVRNERAVATV